MGLFSKEPNEENFVEMFNKLTEEQQNNLKAKLFGEVVKEEEPKEEEPKTEEVKEEEPKVEEPKGLPDYKAELEASFEAKLKELDDKYMAKFAEFTKVKTEQKPFGLTEGNKEYKATAKPKETSEDYIRKLFSK